MSIRMTGTPDRPARSGRKTTALVPAAARAATALSQDELVLSGDAIETFTKAVGGRAKLLDTLSIADTDVHADKVVNCLLDPAYRSWSLRRICAYAGITVADLFASYKKALFVQAHIEAAHLITAQLGPIVADVMARALPQPMICPRCQGAPTTPGTTDCPQCLGKGQILIEPDLDRQKLALELGKLIERRAGVVVQQNAIATSSGGAATNPGSLEQLQQAVGDLLFSPQRRRAAAPPIDVTPEPADRTDRTEPADPPDDAPDASVSSQETSAS